MENQDQSLAQSKKGIKTNVLSSPTSKTHNLADELIFLHGVIGHPNSGMTNQFPQLSLTTIGK